MKVIQVGLLQLECPRLALKSKAAKLKVSDTLLTAEWSEVKVSRCVIGVDMSAGN